MSRVSMRGPLFAVLGVAASLSAAARPATAANLVVNGSFEQPSVPYLSYRFYSSIPGWTLAFGPYIEVQNNHAGSPYDGQQLAELDSTGSSGFYQDLTTTPGATYTLKFAFSPRPGRGSADNVLNVSWGGSLIATLVADGSALSNTSWQVYTYHVTATDTTTRLGFSDGGSSNQLGTYLDAVSVELDAASYSVTALYDQTKAHKSGSTVPIKIQLYDPSGVNVSSSSVVVTATGLARLDESASTQVEDSGNANSPDSNFRYDASLAGYVFNLSTKGLTTGTWVLSFTVGADPTLRTVQFDVR